MSDLIVVGGFVPSLLIDQKNLDAQAVHIGTMDLDVGLAFQLITEERYQEVADRLQRAAFEPDKNNDGMTTRQRWKISDPPVTVDFLIDPQPPKKPGSMFSITNDWAAIVVPGLHLAFQNNKSIVLKGETIAGESVADGREIKVCGAGAFLVLKANAFRIRGENKDAYDLIYLLQNYGNGVADVAAELRPLLVDETASKAMEYLRGDFMDSNSVGPRRVAEFLLKRPDADTQADAVGVVRELLAALKQAS